MIEQAAIEEPDDHQFDLTFALGICTRCGMPFADWINDAKPCWSTPAAAPPDPLWDAVVAVAQGTNATTPAPGGSPCEP